MSAITTSVIIGVAAAGASAGATVYAAKKGASAAHEAANQQSSAAEKALALQKEQYGQARQDFSPYQQAGQAAVGRLGQMATAPRQNFVPGQPPSLGNPMGMGAGQGGLMMQPQPMPDRAQLGGQVPPNPFTGGAISGGQAAAMGGAMPPQAQGPPQGQMVLMQAPDGTQEPVPAHLVPQFLAKGGRVVPS